MKCNKECADLCNGAAASMQRSRCINATEPLRQCNGATSTGRDSAVHVHLKVKGHCLEDASVHRLTVKENICVHCDRPWLWFITATVCRLHCSLSPHAHLGQVISAGHVTGWGKVSQWFRPKPLDVMTKPFSTSWLM